MLVRLLYASRACQAIDEILLKSILEQSQVRNLEHGITGILCTYADGDVFLQVIEGARDEVNALYGNIVRDRRHRAVTLLHYGEIEQRRFGSWRMGGVDLKKVNLSTILRFSERPTLDPFAMTGSGALARSGRFGVDDSSSSGLSLSASGCGTAMSVASAASESFAEEDTGCGGGVPPLPPQQAASKLEIIMINTSVKSV